jgi:hypothetical protein
LTPIFGRSWYSAAGLRFLDEGHLGTGELSEEVAKKLCADLGVDAVVTLSNSWGTGLGSIFHSTAENIYRVDAYDRDGTRVWSDVVQGLSRSEYAVPLNGAIESDDATWKAVQDEAFASALKGFKRHLER